MDIIGGVAAAMQQRIRSVALCLSNFVIYCREESAKSFRLHVHPAVTGRYVSSPRPEVGRRLL